MPTTRRGDERRRAILRRATHLASVEGLEGVTLGRLATELGISKGGLQALFGTKQELQLAIVGAAVEVFQERVLDPAERAPDGLPRLRALLGAWIDYLEVFEGGCFFTAAAAEFDGREGPVRDAILLLALAAHDLAGTHVRLAVRLGELAPDTDADQLVFELHGAILAANQARQLLGRPDALDRARRAVRDRLDRAAAPA
ncbi:TetR/AcrR family transcriptional regulator [Streptomyces sp. NBC_01803]|uniref:TetR/AcrR family transcriptional regulator n=1 Tax=Streptomyces sp. NBC_01803 TaxID=2975946 RepID=UPI002DDBD879|nr:TetR/AcrR family transcriptional regulator [Streptomyces sp. NBC_01803]WSA43348.1 TetR/AcrR family transcriptional regulator [Streptomyces sp. NBC_01803]